MNSLFLSAEKKIESIRPASVPQLLVMRGKYRLGVSLLYILYIHEKPERILVNSVWSGMGRDARCCENPGAYFPTRFLVYSTAMTEKDSKASWRQQAEQSGTACVGRAGRAERGPGPACRWTLLCLLRPDVDGRSALMRAVQGDTCLYSAGRGRAFKTSFTRIEIACSVRLTFSPVSAILWVQVNGAP